MMVGNFHILETSYEISGVSEAMLAPILLQIVESIAATDSIYLKTHPLGFIPDEEPKLGIQIVSKDKTDR